MVAGVGDKVEEEGQVQETGHKGHYMKTINVALTQALNDKAKLRLEMETSFDKINAAQKYFAGIEEIFVR